MKFKHQKCCSNELGSRKRQRKVVYKTVLKNLICANTLARKIFKNNKNYQDPFLVFIFTQKWPSFLLRSYPQKVSTACLESQVTWIGRSWQCLPPFRRQSPPATHRWRLQSHFPHSRSPAHHALKLWETKVSTVFYSLLWQFSSSSI